MGITLEIDRCNAACVPQGDQLLGCRRVNGPGRGRVVLQEGGPWQCPAPGEACGALPSPAALPQFLQGGAPHCCLFFFPMNEH